MKRTLPDYGGLSKNINKIIVLTNYYCVLKYKRSDKPEVRQSHYLRFGGGQIHVMSISGGDKVNAERGLMRRSRYCRYKVIDGNGSEKQQRSCRM